VSARGLSKEDEDDRSAKHQNARQKTAYLTPILVRECGILPSGEVDTGDMCLDHLVDHIEVVALVLSIVSTAHFARYDSERLETLHSGSLLNAFYRIPSWLRCDSHR
jgi:hypothetical protein